MRCLNPFALPDRLDPDLQPVLSFWERLRRAENGMPFGDDLRFSDLSNLPAKSFVLAVFAAPERFRFEVLDKHLQGAAMAGRFVDEIAPDANFSFLRAQGSATLEAAEPTFLHLTEETGRSLGRLLLPMWGNGQISTLLGAISG